MRREQSRRGGEKVVRIHLLHVLFIVSLSMITDDDEAFIFTSITLLGRLKYFTMHYEMVCSTQAKAAEEKAAAEAAEKAAKAEKKEKAEANRRKGGRQLREKWFRETTGAPKEQKKSVRMSREDMPVVLVQDRER